jgi:hypothetical protein
VGFALLVLVLAVVLLVEQDLFYLLNSLVDNVL